MFCSLDKQIVVLPRFSICTLLQIVLIGWSHSCSLFNQSMPSELRPFVGVTKQTAVARFPLNWMLHSNWTDNGKVEPDALLAVWVTSPAFFMFSLLKLSCEIIVISDAVSNCRSNSIPFISMVSGDVFSIRWTNAVCSENYVRLCFGRLRCVWFRFLER